MKMTTCHVANDSVADRVLFVWDGTAKHLRFAESFLEHLGNPKAYVIRTMPHESIYTYGSIGQSSRLSSLREKRVELAFRLATTSKPRLKAAAFRVLFGDTVREIARFAELYKATVVLVPAYEQSSFSRWIHGNLNERLIRKMDCDLVFLNWASKTSQGTATRETS